MYDFYPRTLKREWYTEAVCDSVFAALRGAKYWTSFYYVSRVEKQAYLEAFEHCQKLVKDHDMHPKEMLQALSNYHDTLPLLPKPPFFSLARWFYDPLEARDTAVRTVFELVDGICTRFLP